jgi:hypothetical protein
VAHDSERSSGMNTLRRSHARNVRTQTTGTADLADFVRRVLESDTAHGYYIVGDGRNLRLGLEAGYPPSARVSLNSR